MSGSRSGAPRTGRPSRSFAEPCAHGCERRRSWTSCNLRAMWRTLTGACGARGAEAKQSESVLKHAPRNSGACSGELGRPRLGPFRDVALQVPGEVLEAGRLLPAAARDLAELDRHHGIGERSEEHTSELQSP